MSQSTVHSPQSTVPSPGPEPSGDWGLRTGDWGLKTGDFRSHLIALGLLAALTLALFGDVLFAARPVVLSNPETDLFGQFLHWRAFGFGELARGNLALWNPHLFSGAPFFGGFQSALLYPPNALFLVLPLDRAVNWSIALHVFLAGAFTYAWAARRGLTPAAAFLAAAVFMFGGAQLPHVYAGHLSNLCTLAWAPLLFLAIDGLGKATQADFSIGNRQSAIGNQTVPLHVGGYVALGWVLLGTVAVAMQVLAGHPQYVFYTGVAAAIYSVFCLFQVEQRGRFVAGLAGIVLGGVALSAVQLFTSFQESGEMLRSAGLSYASAASFSFPPENLLTLVAPWFFGDLKAVAYWGQCQWCEMSGFIGVGGLTLAVAGAVWGDRRARRHLLWMAALMILLALGSHTPLFRLLHAWVPGFDLFRGSSKFMFLACLFLALLAGCGFDALRQRFGVIRGAADAEISNYQFSISNLKLDSARPPASPPGTPRHRAAAGGSAALLTGQCRRLSWLAGAALAAGLLFLAGAVAVRAGNEVSGGWWAEAVRAVGGTAEFHELPREGYRDPAFVLQAGLLASRSLRVAGAAFLSAAALVFLLPRFRAAAWLLAGLAVIELFVFGRRSLDRFELADALNPRLRQHLAAHPGDYRILNIAVPNAALSAGALDLWGQDPGVTRRYAQVIGLTQGVAPDEAGQFLRSWRDHPLFRMLRCRFMFVPEGDRMTVYERTNALPRLLLVPRCRVLPGRDEMLSALMSERFDPEAEVLLESVPVPAPEPAGSPGAVELVDSSTDHLTVRAELPSPAILLVTDTYARGWRARALPGSSQARYDILPANYCLRAVPLAAGSHRLRLEYLPSGFAMGRWVSGMGLLMFAAVAAGWWRGHLKRGTSNIEHRTTNAEGNGPKVEAPPGGTHSTFGVRCSAFDVPRLSGTAPLRSPRNRDWLLGLVLIAAVFLAYQPVWRAGFIWDDDTFLLENALIKASDGLHRFWFTTAAPDYFPLTSTTLWLEWRLWGANPLGYHLVNVLLHALSSVLLWRVLRGLRIPGAWLAAALFALHPVNVESVAWITERKNTLAMVFFLLTVWAFTKCVSGVRGRGSGGERGESRVHSPQSTVHNRQSAIGNRQSAFWYCLALLFFALALLSKTAVVTLPFVLLLIAWWRSRQEAREPREHAHPSSFNLHTSLLRLAPFFALALALGLVTLWFQSQRAIGAEAEVVRVDSFLSRLAGAGWAAWFYLGKALVPLNLSFVYPRWQIDPASLLAYVPGLALVAGLAVCWFQRRTWGKAWLFAGGYFVLLLLPVLGFANIYFMRYSLVADHWQYFAIIGPLTLVAAGVSAGLNLTKVGAAAEIKSAIGNRQSAIAICTVLLLTLGTLTWRQARVYENADILWADTLRRNPDCWLAHNNLGNARLQEGKADEAIAHHRKALALEPDNPGSHNNLGNALLQSGRADEAIASYQKALELKPDDARTLSSLGNVLLQQGRVDEAIAHFQKALRVKSDYEVAHCNLGIALLQQGRVDEAIAHFQRALELRPDHALACKNLGYAFAAQGHLREASAQLERALQIRPDHPEVQNNLAWLLATAPDAAVRHGARAVELAERANQLTGGEAPTVLHTLAAAYAEAGRFSDAIRSARKALELAQAAGENGLVQQLNQDLRRLDAGQPLRQENQSP